jgi:hypothetical protein
MLTHSVENQSSDVSMFFNRAGKDQNTLRQLPLLEVAGLLVRPKYMTRGSKRPLFVQNATFHLSLRLSTSLLMGDPDPNS